MWPKSEHFASARPTPSIPTTTTSDDAVFVEYSPLVGDDLLVRRVYAKTTTETIEEVFVQEAAVPSSSSSSSRSADVFENVNLDHLTQRFQQLCFNSSNNGSFTTDQFPGPHNALVPRSAGTRFRRPPAGLFVRDGEPYVFNNNLNLNGQCVHLTQPGRSGFKMFLRMSRGLQTRLRTLSEMDGRSARRTFRHHRSTTFNPEFPLRASPYAAPTPPPSPRRQFFSVRRGSRFDLLQPSARIPEESVEDELSARLDSVCMPGCLSPPPSPHKGKTLEDILRRGSELPQVFASGASKPTAASTGTEMQTLQQARDIDRVVRGLKFLAVT